jgi:hypothetical protein
LWNNGNPIEDYSLPQGHKCRKTGNQPEADANVFRASSKWERVQSGGVPGECGLCVGDHSYDDSKSSYEYTKQRLKQVIPTNEVRRELVIPDDNQRYGIPIIFMSVMRNLLLCTNFTPSNLPFLHQLHPLQPPVFAPTSPPSLPALAFTLALSACRCSFSGGASFSVGARQAGKPPP